MHFLEGTKAEGCFGHLTVLPGALAFDCKLDYVGSPVKENQIEYCGFRISSGSFLNGDPLVHSGLLNLEAKSIWEPSQQHKLQ